MQSKEPPVLVLVAFGAISRKAREVYDHIMENAQKRYPGYDIRWAYTSNFARKKLKDEGYLYLNPQEMLDDLKQEGKKNVIFQPFHIVPGEEVNQKINILNDPDMNIVHSSPLIHNDNDIEQVVDILANVNPELEEGVPTVICAHGNNKYPEYNQHHLKLNEILKNRFKNAHVASIEGEPGTKYLELLKGIVEKKGRIHFIPLMVTAGTHVREDIMGNREDSWKEVIKAPLSTCSVTLGHIDEILSMYFEHLDKAIVRMNNRINAPLN